MTCAGNRTLATRTLALKSRPGQPFSESLLAQDRQTITRQYRAAGFYGQTVEAERELTARGVRIRFRITEGDQARIGTVRLRGNRMIATASLSSLLPIRRGPFTELGVKRNVEALLDFYGENGYPFCEIRPESLRLAGDSVSYVLHIAEGSEVRLADVRFQGRTETRTDLLRRLLGLKLDRTYSEKETHRRIVRLDADPLLSVTGYDIRKNEGEYWLEVRVQEQKANRVAGAVAYSAQDRELAGTVNLDLENLFGTRRSVSLVGQRGLQRQDLSFRYTEPWLLGSNVALTVGVRNRQRDTSYSATEFSAAGKAAIAEAWSLSLGSGYERTTSGRSDLPSVQTYWGNSEMELETRNYPPNPTQGVFARLGIKVGSRRGVSVTEAAAGVGSPSYTVTWSELDLAWVLPLMKRLSFTVAGHGRNVSSSDTVYEYDRYELGGANSLRGFREGQFSTVRCAWLNDELRYQVSRTGYVYPFFDLAVRQQPDAQDYVFEYGYGAGIRAETRLGLAGLDYGIPAGQNPLRGKVHFSVQTRF